MPFIAADGALVLSTNQVRLVKAKQRIAHPLFRRIVRDANDAHKRKSQRVGHPEPPQPVKDAPPANFAWARTVVRTETVCFLFAP